MTLRHVRHKEIKDQVEALLAVDVNVQVVARLEKTVRYKMNAATQVSSALLAISRGKLFTHDHMDYNERTGEPYYTRVPTIATTVMRRSLENSKTTVNREIKRINHDIAHFTGKLYTKLYQDMTAQGIKISRVTREATNLIVQRTIEDTIKTL